LRAAVLTLIHLLKLDRFLCMTKEVVDDLT
jgi:hypothetical protein